MCVGWVLRYFIWIKIIRLNFLKFSFALIRYFVTCVFSEQPKEKKLEVTKAPKKVCDDFLCYINSQKKLIQRVQLNKIRKKAPQNDVIELPPLYCVWDCLRIHKSSVLRFLLTFNNSIKDTEKWESGAFFLLYNFHTIHILGSYCDFRLNVLFYSHHRWFQ